MKFAVDRQLLSGVLGKMFAISPARSPKEVLRNVRAELRGNELEMQATDEEVSLSVAIEVDGGADGVCLFPPRLQAICREASGDMISIESGEQIRVACGTGEWILSPDDPSMFPQFAKSEGEEVQLSVDSFMRAATRTVFACDPQSTRYALGGVLLECDGEDMTMAATDSRRLSVHSVKVEAGPKVEGVVVPAKGIKAAIGICEGEKQISIRCSSRAAEFVVGKSKLHARLVEGRFPRYRDVIPKEFAVEFRSVAGPLVRVIRQSMIVATDDSRGVDFSFADGMLKITTSGPDVGKSEVELPIECDGMFDCSLDPRFLLEFLKVLDPGDAAVISANDAGSAIQVVADRTQYIVMPLSRDE